MDIKNLFEDLYAKFEEESYIKNSNDLQAAETLLYSAINEISQLSRQDLIKVVQGYDIQRHKCGFFHPFDDDWMYQFDTESLVYYLPFHSRSS
jgi:hypothetical protein